MYVSAQRCVGHDKALPESGRASIVSCYHSSALRSLTHIKLHGANLLYFSSVDLPVLWATNVLVGHDAPGALAAVEKPFKFLAVRICRQHVVMACRPRARGRALLRLNVMVLLRGPINRLANLRQSQFCKPMDMQARSEIIAPKRNGNSEALDQPERWRHWLRPIRRRWLRDPLRSRLAGAAGRPRMPGDPKECRKHAARCAEMAVAAYTPQLRATFLELSKHGSNLQSNRKALSSKLPKVRILGRGSKRPSTRVASSEKNSPTLHHLRQIRAPN
jgi:hypothetical protein